jgi:hypothetical protein
MSGMPLGKTRIGQIENPDVSRIGCWAKTPPKHMAIFSNSRPLPPPPSPHPPTPPMDGLGLALFRILHLFLRPDGPSSSTVRICWSIVCRLCGSILIAFLSPTAVPVGKCRHNRYLLDFLNSKTSSMKIVTYVDICRHM